MAERKGPGTVGDAVKRGLPGATEVNKGGKKYREISPAFVVFEAEGDSAAGTYQGHTSVVLKQGNREAEVKRHTLRDDGGRLYSFLGGAQLDELLGNVEVGTDIKLVYTGKVKTGSGQFVKTFKLYQAEA